MLHKSKYKFILSQIHEEELASLEKISIKFNMKKGAPISAIHNH